MDAKLILLADDGRPGEFKLKLPVIVGRSRQAGLTVLHSSVSRQHCEVTEYEGQLVVNDLGSLNGTFIEETRIAEPTILPDGGLLRVGSVRFQAVYGAGALAPPPVPAPQGAGAVEEEVPNLKPETIPLEPAGADEELELTLDEDSAVAGPPPVPEDAPLDFLPWDVAEGSPQGPPASPPQPAEEAPPSLAAPAKKGAPSPAPKRAPAPAAAKPAAAPAKPAGPQKPLASDEQTVSFVPGEPAAPPAHEEAFADDLDSFFKSLQ